MRQVAAKKAARKKTTSKSTTKRARKKVSSKKTARKKLTRRKVATERAPKPRVTAKKAVRKKVARRTAARKKAARQPARQQRGGDWKTRGSAASRRLIRQIAKRILQESAGRTREEAAQITGAHVSDIKNLKAGNLPSLKLVLRIVRQGGYDPEALIHRNELRKLPAGVSTRNARSKQISERVHRIAKSHDPTELSKATGLSIYTIYQHRVANKRVGLHTLLALVNSDVVSAREIFLGPR